MIRYWQELISSRSYKSYKSYKFLVLVICISGLYTQEPMSPNAGLLEIALGSTNFQPQVVRGQFENKPNFLYFVTYFRAHFGMTDFCFEEGNMPDCVHISRCTHFLNCNITVLRSPVYMQYMWLVQIICSVVFVLSLLCLFINLQISLITSWKYRSMKRNFTDVDMLGLREAHR